MDRGHLDGRVSEQTPTLALAGVIIFAIALRDIARC